MEIELSQEEKKELEARHRVERDRRIADRMKAALLSSEGWSLELIAKALRIHQETVRQHLQDYVAGKIKPENGGSQSKLSREQTKELMEHLEEKTYTKVQEICDYVEQHFGVSYSVAGMNDWLHMHGFVYKQPKGMPAKADAAAQKEFVAKYEKLVKETAENEPILFIDSVHPTMATKISHGWIRKGKDKLIATTASRTRINLTGALNLATMEILNETYETIDAEATAAFFKKIKAHYPHAPCIHLILDQSGYHRSQQAQQAAQKLGIQLHYLPPYSPNLNVIERVWKLVNEYARNNVFFQTAKQFRDAIHNFFSITWPKIAHSMIDRINDSFYTHLE